MKTRTISLAIGIAALGLAAGCSGASSSASHTATAAAATAVAAPSVTTDPYGETCPTLDSSGYCPGDDPATDPNGQTCQNTEIGGNGGYCPGDSPSPDCASQVQSWLANTSLFPNGAPLQQGITDIYDDAQTYLSVFASDPSSDMATTELSILGDPNGAIMMTLGQPIPTCADPAGYWQDVGTQFGNATSTDAGTPQAASDMHAVLSDLKSLLTELGQTTPGSGLTLPNGGTQ